MAISTLLLTLIKKIYSFWLAQHFNTLLFFGQQIVLPLSHSPSFHTLHTFPYHPRYTIYIIFADNSTEFSILVSFHSVCICIFVSHIALFAAWLNLLLFSHYLYYVNTLGACMLLLQLSRSLIVSVCACTCICIYAISFVCLCSCVHCREFEIASGRQI